MDRLGPRASFWTAAAVAGLALWASGAPTVVYPLYARAWDLSPVVTSVIFAVYPLALIPALLLFGNLSDHLGRRTAMLAGLAALAVGALVFGLAGSLGWVLAGRALMGVGVGISLGPASAALVDLSPPDRPGRSSSVTTASTAFGLALATLVGGALVQYAPAPLHLSFWVLLAVTVLVSGLVWFLPPTAPTGTDRWRPHRPVVPRTATGVFWAGALAVSGAYAMGAVYLALGAQVAHDLVGSSNVLVTGAVISLSAISIGVVALLARRLRPRVAVTFGPVAAAAGLGLLVVAGLGHSLTLFLASSVIGGAGYALMFGGGLGLVVSSAPAQHRAAVLSAAYTVGYLLQALAAVGIGALATGSGLLIALEVGSPAVVAVGLVGALLIATRKPPAPVSTVPVAAEPVECGRPAA